MQKSLYNSFLKLLENGQLRELNEKLKPLIKENDLDARFISAHFSIDEEEAGERFDERKIRELSDLADHYHPAALHSMAWHFKHGDDGVEQNDQLFRVYLEAAALLGHPEAIRNLAEQIELDLNKDGFLEHLKISQM